MKICWGNLENVRLIKEGDFRIITGNYISTYIEMDACKGCGEPYLVRKDAQGLFCSLACSTGGKNNAMYGVKISGASNGNYKDGIYTAGLSVYETYKDRLGIYEDIRKQKGTNVLEVRCVYCGRWYTPSHKDVDNRLHATNSLTKGEARLYCSDNCKQSCPTYRQVKYPRDFKKATSREVSTYLRQMVFERDDWICQKCGKTTEEIPLHCHHMDPVAQNPMFQNDMDSCITLCKGCHKEVHMQYGCRYVDLRCKREE